MKISISRADGIVKQLIEEFDKGTYVLRHELWSLPNSLFSLNPEDKPVEIMAAYNHEGHYIGDEKVARRLCDEFGILPEISEPDHSVCSIGWCPKEGKWFGWSHRAIYGFGVGDTCEPGDSGYLPEKGIWTAKTKQQAKQMAKDFAASVSSVTICLAARNKALLPMKLVRRDVEQIDAYVTRYLGIKRLNAKDKKLYDSLMNHPQWSATDRYWFSTLEKKWKKKSQHLWQKTRGNTDKVLALAKNLLSRDKYSRLVELFENKHKLTKEAA